MICDQAYVLDVKPFQETSAIVQVFSAKLGRYSVVFRNVYGQAKKSQQLRSYLQTANMIELSYSSNSSAMPLVFHADLIKSAAIPTSKNYLLLSYINELLLKLLPEHLALEDIFNTYAKILPNIVQGDEVEQSLRQFEWSFLQELDSQTDWYYCVGSGAEIMADQTYQFQLGQGFKQCHDADAYRILGADIIAVRESDFSNAEVVKAAKWIFRQLIKQQLGSKKLRSREAYLALYS